MTLVLLEYVRREYHLQTATHHTKPQPSRKAAISRSLPSCAAMVWSIFQRSWCRYFSSPDVMITDGGPEFRGDFVHSEKYAGILQVIDADTPWQNGKCERHGGKSQGSSGEGL